MKFSELILFARAAPSSAWTRRLGPKWRRSRTQSVRSLKDPDKDSSLGFWPIWRNIFHQGHETYPSEQNCWLCARKLWSSDKTCTFLFYLIRWNEFCYEVPKHDYHLWFTLRSFPWNIFQGLPGFLYFAKRQETIKRTKTSVSNKIYQLPPKEKNIHLGPMNFFLNSKIKKTSTKL